MNPALESKVAALADLLGEVARDHVPAALASSLSIEDMVLTEMIARHRLGIDIFTLDTGRMHGDTLYLVLEIKRRYGLHVQVVTPEPRAVSEYVARFGRDAFYSSSELRRRCCDVRKVQPLRQALAGKRAWITGLRREQSAGRSEVPEREFDNAHGMHKFNPLAGWAEEEIWAYLRWREVPYNPLYDQGYRSIGCAPCTRPVVAGEDARAGRWWWEIQAHGENSSECGIHFSPDGKVIRAKAAA